MHKEVRAHFLPGRGKRAGSQIIGEIHLVVAEHGDNFNTSLCGKEPTGRSLGWQTTKMGVTCAKCKAAISALRGEVE